MQIIYPNNLFHFPETDAFALREGIGFDNQSSKLCSVTQDQIFHFWEINSPILSKIKTELLILDHVNQLKLNN